MWFILSSLFISTSLAIQDLDCTSNGAYTASAVACDNEYSDAACLMLYKNATAVRAEGRDERPAACYNQTNGPSQDVKAMAIASCPKLCGYCCKTPEFSCNNVQFPRINCATIRPQMCRDPIWRDIIAADCPNSCGFCLEGGCIDKSPDCVSQPTICVTRGLEQFANENCKRTCGLCDSVVTPSPIIVTTQRPSTNCVDASASCTSWVRNGFCTNSFYSAADKKKNCAKSCNLC